MTKWISTQRKQRTQKKQERESGRQSGSSTLRKDPFSSFLCDLLVPGVEFFGFYAEDFTGSPATTERYNSRTCPADRSQEYFWTSS